MLSVCSCKSRDTAAGELKMVSDLEALVNKWS